MKLYLYLTIGFSVIFGWNLFLIHRDAQLFEGYKQRQAQVCEQLKEISPDCR